MELAIVVFSGFALATVAPLLHRNLGDRSTLLLALLPLAITIHFGRRLGTSLADEALVERYAWVPAIDLSLSFYLDGLSLLFVLVIAGVGTLVIAYAGAYMHDQQKIGRFHAFLLGFMAAMMGLVLAGNILTLYVFWELTTIFSYLLIGFDHERESARSAAMQGLLTTALGGLAMLAGLILLGLAAGSFELDVLLAKGDLVRGHPHYPAILTLILIGAFAKSAQFPFHYWLPRAMEAPTPVSAYLHSATMVKAGVYLLARLLPVLGHTDQWTIAVTTVGAVTMFVGAYLAYFQHELKAVLAYLTVNLLGSLVMLLGIATELAVKAALTYLVAHALYKCALFMVAGVVSHRVHILDIRLLAGLGRRMPVTCAVAVIGAASMAGVVPLFGFVAKELYLEAAWKAPVASTLLAAVSVGASALLTAAAGMVGLVPFFRSGNDRAQKVHEASFSLLVSPALLALATVFMGLFPQQLAAPVIEPALSSVIPGLTSMELKLWHGFTTPFLLAVAAFVAGAALFAVRRPLLRRLPDTHVVSQWGPEAWYERSVRLVQWAATEQTRLLQSGHLRVYVVTMLATIVLVVGTTMVYGTLPRADQPSIGVQFHEGVAAALILVSAWIAIRSTNRYRAILSLGVIGFSMAWLYVVFSAPDLAMTQVVVEALTILLLVLALRGLPEFQRVSTIGTRLRDAAVALSAGGMVTGILLIVTAFEAQPAVSQFFAEKSYPAAHGRNVVNTILVDFRALDTLGEATVLATAAVGTYTLIRLVVRRSTNG